VQLEDLNRWITETAIGYPGQSFCIILKITF
jgi:hypothetical protein